MHDLRFLTTSALVRLYHRACERMTRGDGYQPFGYDARTLWLTCPGYMEILTGIKSELLRR